MMNDPNVTALLDEMNRLQTGDAGAATAATGAVVPLRRVLGMRSGAELYGIDIESITEISKLTPVTYVPGAPSYILGVTSLRGQIVPVVNLRGILGVDSDSASWKKDGTGAGASAQAKPRIVVVHHGDVVAGFLVDAVTEVYDLRTALEPALGAATAGLPIKEGQVMLGERVLILLHVPSLFAQLVES
jgi:purine-binding chemotaxis protein CheW